MKNKLAIGIDLGGTNMRGGIVDEFGNVKSVVKIKTEADKGYIKIKKNLIKLINEISENNDLKTEISGIGIGCAGLIDHQKGIVIESPNIHAFKSAPLADDINKIVKIPVKLENDANAVGWGEYCCGAGKNTHSMVCFTVGTGIGGGIVLNGKVWRGFTNTAGEVGHIIVKKNGKKCGCGKYGCLEQYAGAFAMVNDAHRAIKKGIKTTLTTKKNLSAYDIYIEAKAGDNLAKKIINDAAEYLGMGIAFIANVFNPEMVIIAGGFAQSGEFFISPVREETKKLAFASAVEKLKIQQGLLGDKAGIIGAAFIIFEN